MTGILVLVALAVFVFLALGFILAEPIYGTSFEWSGATMGGLISLIAGGTCLALYLEFARFDGIAACRAQRMDYIARPASKDVLCIPYPTRQDTTTINANVQQR
jgi:hypothetical protein